MPTQKLLRKEKHEVFLLSNEAIARAILESDVKVTSFYPGSPTSEIFDTLAGLSKFFPDIKIEIATNEKVALETVAGASMAGVRSFTSMKSVGLNVASDTFFSLGYTGVNAGLVLLVADDPHAHSSQSEQDGRFFAEPAHVPMLEPSTAQEAYEMVKWAFSFSEKYHIVVLIRTVTRVNHQSGVVSVGSLERTPFVRRDWKDVKNSFFTLASTARRLKKESLEKLQYISEAFEKSRFNTIIEGEGNIGIVTSSVSFLHTMEALDVLGIKPHVLKLGTTYPLPEKIIASFLKKIETLVVVEELLPYLERHLTAIAKNENQKVRILGKLTNHFSYVGEYDVPKVVAGIATALNIKQPVDYDRYVKRAADLKTILPERMPTFCPGCPHRGTLWAIQQALKKKEYVLNNDIGCYSMFLLKPYAITDSLLCMGSSLGISEGMQHVLNDKVVSLVGDSTFFHAALPGLVNAVHNKHMFTLVILDNSVTAMTGQQPNPGSDFGPSPVERIDIEAVVRAIGVKHITVINAFDPKPNIDKIKEALAFEGVSVIISKGPCALYYDRIKRMRGNSIMPNKVDPKTCKSIYACILEFYCPAIELDMTTRQIAIKSSLCDGCMVCAHICPISAIQSTKGGNK